ncbi:MAG TPA: LytTR family transcriptional regulator DNA-binding domain-containing protein [Longimicrobiales bacterium]|nr:LytTR family transcriptional regulator DNA-binding domain-containing protein [Longimicrobiales bacterium]
MEKIRALIVDDEPLAREGMRIHLEEHADIDVIGECGDGATAVMMVRDVRPDLIFLDVQMSGLDGFGVLRAVGAEHMPIVVFVTAYDEFALQAFEAHAIDYLLKPIDPDRLDNALERVRNQLQGRSRRERDERVLTLLSQVGAQPRYIERLVTRSDGRIRIIRVDDIDYIEAAGNYAKIHVSGKMHLVREGMNSLESKLDPSRFLRIHRSVIVRIDRIKELESLYQGDYVVVLQDGTRLTTGRKYRDAIQEFIRGA